MKVRWSIALFISFSIASCTRGKEPLQYKRTNGAETDLSRGGQISDAFPLPPVSSPSFSPLLSSSSPSPSPSPKVDAAGPVNPGPVVFTYPVLEFFRSGPADHYYTLYASGIPSGFELRTESSGQWRVLGGPSDGAEPVFELVHKITGQHYYTMNTSEIEILVTTGSFHNYNKVIGYMFRAEHPTTSEVYHLYNTQSGDHIFTADLNRVLTLLSINPGLWQKHASLGFSP